MFFVVDKARLQRMINIVREDRTEGDRQNSKKMRRARFDHKNYCFVWFHLDPRVKEDPKNDQQTRDKTRCVLDGKPN